MSRNQKRIVAVALLSADDVNRLGKILRRIYSVDESPCFDKLVRDIDEVDRALCSREKRNCG